MKSIRNRMMFYLIVGATILFGLLYYLSQVALNPLPEMNKEQYSEIVSARADEVSRKLEGMVDQLTIVAHSPVVKSMNMEWIKAYLPSLALDVYRNLTIAYPDGSAWSTLNQDLNIAQQQQFQEIFVQRKSYAISQPFLSEYIFTPNQPIVTLSHDVLSDEGELVGLVNFVISIDFLNQIVGNLDLASGGYGWIMNQDGMIVAHQDSSLSFHGHVSQIISDDQQIEALMASSSGSYSYTKPDGVRMIAFIDEITGSPDWKFIVSVEEASIYHHVNNIKSGVVTGLLSAFLIVVIFSYFYSQKLVEPIVQFTKLFHQAAGGDLSVRANEHNHTEIGVAAQTFNTMLERIKVLTYQDVTTYLYNYNGFLLELPQRLKQLINHRRTIAVVIVSIDDFKKINSISGYQVGDAVLRQFSQRLLQSLHGQGLAARFLGDEFIMLIQGDSKEDIEHKVHQLWDLCSGEFVVDENRYILHTSIGASILSNYATPIDTIIHEATVAKLIVKKEGGSQYRFYNLDLDLQIKLEQKIETSLYYALVNQELFLVYQPIVDVLSNQIVATESLLRWNHPEFKSISIQKVIQIAEQSGMIIDIGRWILHEACTQNKKWQMAGNIDLVISVNVSALQFEQENFVSVVREILEETKMNPATLELEITEHIAMDHVYEKLNKMKQLQEMGVRIALDDFGTGYSSLAYFSRFPINTLKIDRSFIVDLLSDENAQSITTTIINLAKSIHITTTAEGVETKEQLDYLRKLDIDKIQGYYFSKPALPEVIDGMLVRQDEDFSMV